MKKRSSPGTDAPALLCALLLAACTSGQGDSAADSVPQAHADSGETAGSWSDDTAPPLDSAIPDLVQEPSLCLNELMPLARYSQYDDHGEVSDWIELFSYLDHDLDLGGYSLATGLSGAGKFPLADGLVLPAGGFLVLWADADPDSGDSHLDFQLPDEGGLLGLYDPAGEPLEILEYGDLGQDMATGRYPDGNVEWDMGYGGTPGASNQFRDMESLFLVESGAEWSYLDTGSDEGSAWKEPEFDDSSWSAGPSPLGYGDSQSTVVSYGPNYNDKYITTYFRHDFSITDATEILVLDLSFLVDDGGIVYLNGVEVLRRNMPDGVVDYHTTASTTVSGSAESEYLSYTLDSSLLVDGQNLLAVEVHQVSPTSSDITMDLRLEASRYSEE